MNFCSKCGAEVIFKVPAEDNRPRHICIRCETIYYSNPKIVTGCIVEWEGKVLLCKRVIEPRYGLWTLPAGFMEVGETTVQAALRETQEEANATVDLLDLYLVINLPYVDQVYMIYRSRLAKMEFSPGSESLEVKLYKQEEIPWDSLAFPTIRETLQYYFRDKADGRFLFRTGDIIKENNQFIFHPGPGVMGV